MKQEKDQGQQSKLQETAARRIQNDEAARARRKAARELRMGRIARAVGTTTGELIEALGKSKAKKLAEAASRNKMSPLKPVPAISEEQVGFSVGEHILSEGVEVSIGDGMIDTLVIGEENQGTIRDKAITSIDPNRLSDDMVDGVFGLPSAEIPPCGDVSLDAIQERISKRHISSLTTFGAPTRFDQDQ